MTTCLSTYARNPNATLSECSVKFSNVVAFESAPNGHGLHKPQVSIRMNSRNIPNTMCLRHPGNAPKNEHIKTQPRSNTTSYFPFSCCIDAGFPSSLPV